MSAWTRWRARLRTIFDRDGLDRELDRELDAWVDELSTRHRARGVPADEARRRALAETGAREQVRANVHEARLGNGIETTVGDVRYAWRGLWRTPAFALVTILTLGLGIGATTAIFSLVNALLLADLPFREPSRLMLVWRDSVTPGYQRSPINGPEIEDLRQRATRFSGFGGIWSNTAVITGDDPEQLRVGLVTSDFFSVLGAAPALGRTFDAGDDAPTATRALLLSDALWRRRYGADPAIVGRTVQIGGQPTTVIGVMAPSFRTLLPVDAAVPDDLQAWLLLPSNYREWPRGQRFLRVVARLKPDATMADGAQEIDAIGHAIAREFAYSARGPRVLYAVGLHADGVRGVQPMLWTVFAGVALLLTAACVNVASLLVARAAARGRETAVRVALGAGAMRLFRQYAIEGVVLGVLGGTAGLAIGYGLLSVLLALRPSTLSRLDAASIDPVVMAFTAAVALGWGLVVSLAPLAEARRVQASGVISHGDRSSGTGVLYHRRAALVVCQLAVSVVLLVGAGLITRTFLSLMSVDPGFSSDHTLTFRLSLPWERFASTEASTTFATRFRERLAALPGVSGVGAISHVPYDELPNWGGPYMPEGETDARQVSIADYRAITPGVFELMDVHLVDGRLFTAADSSHSIPVAIVDERFARRMWPDETAIGRRFIGDPYTSGKAATVITVVGVVRHLRHRQPTLELSEQIYVPVTQGFRNPMAYFVKSAIDATALVPQIREALRGMDAALPIYDVRPLSAYVANARADRRFTMLLIAAFAVVALVLASIGVYGVTTYAVARRRREFGVRLAIGASRRQVMRLVMGESVRLGVMGLLLGLAGAAVTASLLQTQLYGVTPRDPASYAVSGAVLALAVAIAAWLPARRATRVSPMESLRAE